MGLSWITIEPFYTAAQKKALRTIFHIPRISRYCPGHTKQVLITNRILTVHNLYFSSVLHAIFLSLFSNTPKPIADQIKLHLSTRTDHYFLLSLLKYTNLEQLFKCLLRHRSTGQKYAYLLEVQQVQEMHQNILSTRPEVFRHQSLGPSESQHIQLRDKSYNWNFELGEYRLRLISLSNL